MIKLKFAQWRLNNMGNQIKMLMCNLKMVMLNSFKIPFWETSSKTKCNRLNHDRADSTNWHLLNSLRKFPIDKSSWTTSRINVACTALPSEIWIRSSPQMCCVERNFYWDKVKLKEYPMHPISRNSLWWIFGITSKELPMPLKCWSTFLIIVARLFPVKSISWTWSTLLIEDLW